MEMPKSPIPNQLRQRIRASFALLLILLVRSAASSLRSFRRQFGERASRIAADLSGGLDSAIVAIITRDLIPELRTYGVIVPAPNDEAQAARRTWIAEQFELRDCAISAEPVVELNCADNEA
jgi:asparagine synthetase B (glutamine-hydrolysing)